MTEHGAKVEELLSSLGTDGQRGLSWAQAEEILGRVGPNKLGEARKKSNLARFIDQFKDAMIIILLIAALVSFIIAFNGNDPMEFIEPGLIVLIVVLNALMGMIQESKAEKSLEALRNMSAPHAKVLRDGQETVIDASAVVPGDILLLEAGDFVPADARLIQSASLKCEESALTGESVPVEKRADAEVGDDAALGDRINMVYSGCSVTYGRARAVVTQTGMNTQIGKIAGMLAQQEEGLTPLQQKLANLGKVLGIVALITCAVIFVIGLIDGIPIMEIFMTAVSLAVSAIPEGLPAIVTVVLSIGVQQMVRHNAIIRRLPAVETLGSASVICSDKTGTLTQNRMTLMKVYSARTAGTYDVDGALEGEPLDIVRLMTLCCDGAVEIEGDKVSHIGDPTETAVVLAAHRSGLPKSELSAAYPRVAELPFDSDRKLMTTVCRFGEGDYRVIVKGAFDMLSQRCAATDENARRLAAAARVTDEMGQQALRVLALGVKTLDHVPAESELTSEALESGLELIGLVGMIDPPREEAKEAVAVCRQAGIRPIMITGDHVVTASAIARAIGIIPERPDPDHDNRAITGAELQAMSEAQLDDEVEDISVYARVSPEDKIRIVKAWQRKDQVVAMTGDGVNDAPALKAADIGCAMGITGTDVAKGAADMTLTDDNFATIVEAVRQGRGIYANIKKCVGFLLGTNIGELLSVFVSMLLFRVSPFLSMQLLWINLVTDSLPAIALGMEAIDEGVMNDRPKSKNEGVFAHGMGLQVVLQGVMFGALALIGFSVGRSLTGTLAGGRTMAFMVMALSQVFHAFNMRSGRSLIKTGPFTNKYLNGAALLSIAMMCLVLFIPPVASAFGLIMMTPWQYVCGLLLALVPIPALELAKALNLVRHHK